MAEITQATANWMTSSRLPNDRVPPFIPSGFTTKPTQIETPVCSRKLQLRVAAAHISPNPSIIWTRYGAILPAASAANTQLDTRQPTPDATARFGGSRSPQAAMAVDLFGLPAATAILLRERRRFQNEYALAADVLCATSIARDREGN